MHDIGDTLTEYEDELDALEGEELELDIGDEELLDDTETPFSEEEEMELAAELLSVTDEAEMDQFLGKLFKKVGRAVGKFARSGVGRALGKALKGVARKALPIAGRALGTFVGGPAGGVIGGKLASMAGRAFGLELEGLSQDEMEFEIARRFVRLAGAAARKAALAPASGNPLAIAKNALLKAAKRHAPGLVGRRSSSLVPAGTGRSGRWIRRGRRIILIGV